jgi:hypothetical protein
MGEANNNSDWNAFLHASAKYALDGHRGQGASRVAESSDDGLVGAADRSIFRPADK